jgi:hypothetical protein
MEKRSPASRFLSGQIVDSGHPAEILSELDSLEVSSARWLPENMIQAVMAAVPLATQLGNSYSYIPLFGRCRIAGLAPGSAAELHLSCFHPIGKFLLAINGTSVQTVEEVAGCFHFHLDRTQGLDSLTLLLVSMGVGKNGKDGIDLAPHDHAQLHSVFSVACHSTIPSAPFLTNLHGDKGGGSSSSLNDSILLPVAVVTSKGSSYNVLVHWGDGSETFEPLSVMVKEDPLTCALYVKDRNLLDTPGWKSFKRIATREVKYTRMVKQAKLHQERHGPTYKFGILVPKNRKNAFEIDEKMGINDGSNPWTQRSSRLMNVIPSMTWERGGSSSRPSENPCPLCL